MNIDNDIAVSDVLVTSHNFMRCVKITGDIGEGGRGLGWYMLHPNLWCLMWGRDDRAEYVLGFVTMGEEGWIARAGNMYGDEYGTMEKAMRDTEGIVARQSPIPGECPAYLLMGSI